jgi:hypothetical protein
MSTSGWIARSPARSMRRTIHSGVRAAGSSPRITRPKYCPHAPGSEMRTGRDSGIDAGTAGAAVSLSFAPVIAATSRAMPNIERQSPRLGVSLSVKYTSSSASALRTSSPTFAEGSRTRIPACSSDRPSSRAEQSIPLDSTPRSFAFLISMPGSFAPTSAHGTFCPAATFGAPQTMVSVSPVPASTSVTRSLSALGWGATLFTYPTTMPENSPATGEISSTSRPPIVSLSASALGGRSTSTSSRSQCRETLI